MPKERVAKTGGHENDAKRRSKKSAAPFRKKRRDRHVTTLAFLYLSTIFVSMIAKITEQAGKT
jgi:hypothetical protein